MPEPQSPFKRVRRKFSQAALKRVCEMHETDFEEAYGIEKFTVASVKGPENFYLYQDNGSDILAVAHLDTVMDHHRRTANFVNTAAGPIVFSGALDDRLGAYTILELMPKLGLKFDILLTVGEESGQSTAQYFDKPEGKEYNWMIEFDRGGRDVVMYQYDTPDLRKLVRESGATPADGIFSDISYMGHLEIQGLNWGVGYRDYHGPRSHAYLEDYWEMMGYFLKFHEANKDTYLPHENRGGGKYGGYGYGSLWGGSDEYYWSSSSNGSKAGGYKSTRGEAWWDGDGPTSSDESDEWDDEQWDAYILGGIDAVRDLELEREENADDDDVVMITMDLNDDDADPDDPDRDRREELDDEMISEDFSDVNKALVLVTEPDDA